MKEVIQKSFSAIIMAFLFFLVGCASRFNINPTFKELEEPPIVEKINAKVGISIPEKVHSYMYSDRLSKVAFGESSSSRILEVSSWLFVDTVQITGENHGKKPKLTLMVFLNYNP